MDSSGTIGKIVWGVNLILQGEETMAKTGNGTHWTAYPSGSYMGCRPKGGLGKTFLQNHIKYCYSDRCVISTDMATKEKSLACFLTKFSLACKDKFLFNHPCSTTEFIAYDQLGGIKDGYRLSAKYDTNGLIFKTPNTMIVFSNEYPRTGALKRDRWRVYEIIKEDLFDKTALTTKSRLCSQNP